MLTDNIVHIIANAEAKALATSGPHGVNVVPVSVVEIRGNSIYLYNFFMGKTIENLSAEPEVSLAVWSGLEGVQIKASVTCVKEGSIFKTATEQMKERFPERTLHCIVVLTPHTIYDVSADKERAGMQLAG